MKSIVPHGHRILIVDDNEDMRQALIEALTLQGYHCVAADHGESAIRCLDTDQFHLVISDYRMPVMDGIQFLETLKKRPTPSPPVILLTASKSEELWRRALELGAYVVLLKPFATQELVTLSARAIESRDLNLVPFSQLEGN
jgi:two-component system, NtrC family, C4-dicarboxylate transport response regulator DctD